MKEIVFKGKFFKEGFSKEFPIIETSIEEIKKLQREVLELDEDTFQAFMNITDMFEMPINNFILTFKEMEDMPFEKIQIQRNGDIFNCLVGFEDIVYLEYAMNIEARLTTKVFFNKQDSLVSKAYKDFYEKVFNSERIIHLYLLLMGSIFLFSSNNVTFVESNIQESTTKKENKAVSQNNKIKKDNVISLTKQRIIRLSDITMNKKTSEAIKKTCEYSFTRRGHWAHSHKTNKKWWVSETVVNKDKPRKQTRYRLDTNSVDNQ